MQHIKLNIYGHAPISSKGTSARVRIRAKLKHISQRSATIETNQDSLSNGEWSGRQFNMRSVASDAIVLHVSAHRFNPRFAVIRWSRLDLICNEGIVASKYISSCLLWAYMTCCVTRPSLTPPHTHWLFVHSTGHALDLQLYDSDI